MAGKPRVHEIAREMGVDAKLALRVLHSMGKFAKSPSSTIEPPVARKLRAIIRSGNYFVPALGALDGARGAQALTLIDSLPRSLPALVELLSGDEKWSEMSDTKSEAARRLYYISPRSFASITVPAQGLGRVAMEDLPSERGLLVIHETTERLRVILWYSDLPDPHFQTFTLTVQTLATGERALVPAGAHGTVTTFDVDAQVLSSAAGEFRQLAAVLDAIPVSTVTDTKPEADANPRVGTATVDGSRPGIIYMTRPNAERPQREIARRSPSGEHSRTADKRWTVSGHWRRQWYRSRGEHERIWIEEHTSGARDADVIERPRVYVIAPRRDAHNLGG